MLIDKQAESLHYFHSYAIKDRIKISDVSDVSPSNTPTAELVISTVQPDDEDDALIHDEFAVLVSRILCKHMLFFKSNYADVVHWHIEHKYSREMSKKSDVVRTVLYELYLFN